MLSFNGYGKECGLCSGSLPPHRPEGQGAAALRQPPYLGSRRANELCQPLVLLQVLQKRDGHDTRGISQNACMVYLMYMTHRSYNAQRHGLR